MPYITEAERDGLLLRGMEGASPVIRKSGELNYLISSLLAQYLTEAPIDYDRINSALGAIEAAKLEFYRRIAAPYESGKINTETDVYLPVIKQLIAQRTEAAAEAELLKRAEMATDTTEGA